MEIENLEVSLLKASNIQDGDTVLVRLTEEQKQEMTKEKAGELYNKIKKCVGEDKKIAIFFFPKSMELGLVKDTMKTVLESAEVKDPEENLEQDPVPGQVE